MQRAHFPGEASPYDHATLTRIATEVGVPAEEVAAVLAGDEFTAAVRQDQDEARQLGVTGVPFAVFDRRFAVSGAQGVEVYRLALEQAFAPEGDAT